MSNQLTVLVKCKYCKKEYPLRMTINQYKRLTEGTELITSIFPDYTPGQRELLISQTCDKCWESIMGPEE